MKHSMNQQQSTEAQRNTCLNVIVHSASTGVVATETATGSETNLAERSLRTILKDWATSNTRMAVKVPCVWEHLWQTRQPKQKDARTSYLHNEPAATGAPNTRPQSKKYDKGVGITTGAQQTSVAATLAHSDSSRQAIGTTQINGPLKSRLRTTQLHGHV